MGSRSEAQRIYEPWRKIWGVEGGKEEEEEEKEEEEEEEEK